MQVERPTGGGEPREGARAPTRPCLGRDTQQSLPHGEQQGTRLASTTKAQESVTMTSSTSTSTTVPLALGAGTWIFWHRRQALEWLRPTRVATRSPAACSKATDVF